MLNFLLDIAPDKSQLLLTIKLAGILREKKQEVYYTYTSNHAFTPVLYDKGISNCVLYPDDFRWLKPDLTLLDCRHAAHASLYRQLAIDYIFIAMQLPDQKNIQDKDISILYLPPTPYLSSGSGPRLETLTKRLQDIKKDKEIITFLRVSRNTVHNSGIHEGGNLSLELNGKKYELIAGKPRFSHHIDMILLHCELVDIYANILNSINDIPFDNFIKEQKNQHTFEIFNKFILNLIFIYF